MNAATLAQEIMGRLESIESALKTAHYVPESAGLSPAEYIIAQRVKAPCILETEATLQFGTHSIDLTLRAYGKWHPAYSGISERGERPTSPPEPAHYEVDSVTISTGARDGYGQVAEAEIWHALDTDPLGVIADAAEEE